VEARAARRQDVLTVVDSDIQSVSKSIREIKDRQSETQGTAAAQLDRERKRLAKVATLLCAVRAHARGRVHLAGTLARQERWIHEHAALAKEGPGARSLDMVVERWEVVIEPGQRVEVAGTCQTEAIPPGLGSSDGYRSRLTAQVMRGSDAAPVRVIGVGEIAASESDPASTRAPTPGSRDTTRRWLAALIVLAAVLIGWMTSR
jgi:hypothetical protein